MAHPTRVGAFGVLSEREASPREIAAELGEPVNNVTYHVKQLVKLGCAELVRAAPARGGRVVEHFYRVSRKGWIDDAEWASLGPAERTAFSTNLMRAVSSDINEAMAAGTLFEGDDKHLSRTPMVVDDKGWDEVRSLLDETLMRLLDIRAQAATRTGVSDGDSSYPIKVELLHFRSPAKKTP